MNQITIITIMFIARLSSAHRGFRRYKSFINMIPEGYV